ncbi:MAG: lipoate--protein ligase family protein, partial [Bacteroidales bacterium]|nr:lipoate--protein ligase family protein [Bacteroidales bacterium]
MLYINDPCTDPYWNLAAEEYLLKNFTQPVFRLWRNEGSIIIGHYQNAFAEIDVNFVKENGIKVVRRLTGGGAVFHDLGNLNFTFIEERNPNEDTSVMFRRFTAPIIEALQNIGVDAYLEGRNDLLIDGKKFSGNAFYQSQTHAYHHGTLMVDVDKERLGRYLSPPKAKLEAKGVTSVRSRVVNLKELAPDLTIDK